MHAIEDTIAEHGLGDVGERRQDENRNRLYFGVSNKPLEDGHKPGSLEAVKVLRTLRETEGRLYVPQKERMGNP